MTKHKNGLYIKEDAQTQCMVKLEGPDLQTFYLYDAIENNDLNKAISSIQKGANVNAPTKPCSENQETPLEAAAYWANFYNCSLAMIELLKQAGATAYDREKIEYISESSICSILDIINKSKV